MEFNLERHRDISDSINIRPWLKFVSTGNHDFLYKVFFNKTEICYDIMVSNGYQLLKESLTEEQFREKCKMFNPNIEANCGSLLTHLENGLFNGVENKSLNVAVRDDVWDISLKFKVLSSIPFIWTFSLHMCTTEEISNTLFDPTYVMLNELLRRQQELYILLEKKDREIQDYRDNGAVITRKHLQTLPFDRKAFENVSNLNKDFISSCSSSTSNFTVLSNDATKNIYRSIMMNKQSDQSQLAGQRDPVDPLKRPTFDTLSQQTPLVPNLPSWNEAGRLPKSIVNEEEVDVNLPITTGLTPEKDKEKERREALRRRLEDESERKNKKKKRKLKI